MLYLGLFMLLPLLLVIVLSFLTRGPYGNEVYQFNLGNYARLIDSLYLRILLYSLWVAFATTMLTILIGYPLAYYIARVPVRQRYILLFLILVPFWTNFIIRIYAWIMILRTEGLLNTLLLNLGLIQVPLDILYSPTAVLIGMVYEYLPFMVLPLIPPSKKSRCPNWKRLPTWRPLQQRAGEDPRQDDAHPREGQEEEPVVLDAPLRVLHREAYVEDAENLHLLRVAVLAPRLVLDRLDHAEGAVAGHVALDGGAPLRAAVDRVVQFVGEVTTSAGFAESGSAPPR